MSGPTHEIRKLQPAGSPVPKEAYSHGILIPLPGADMLLVTGQIATDPDGKAVAPNDPMKQAEVVFEKIGKILAGGGLDFRDVVKAQIFLTNIKDFPLITKVRNRYFAESKPVSTMVEVSKLVREGCCIEVEVIAIRLHPKN
jgi:2-iminobutanoate/2-iminopropanoate deaminase